MFEAGPRAFLDGASSLGRRRPDEVRRRADPGLGAARGAGATADGASTSGRRGGGSRRPGDPAAAYPRSRNEVAAVRGALWATVRCPGRPRADDGSAAGTGRRLSSWDVEALRDQARPPPADSSHAVILDLMDGVRSLGELDFARECRRRGLPEPSRQVVRRGRNGSYYLDVTWDDLARRGRDRRDPARLGAERRGRRPAPERRHARATPSVLRLPLLGLRVAADDFFDADRAGAAPKVAGQDVIRTVRHSDRTV